MNRKKVLITGAGTGIGLACVNKFLDDNWVVYAHYHRSCGDLKKIQQSVGSKNLILQKFDFTNMTGIGKFISFIKGLDLDALVNNAALYDFSYQQKNRLKSLQMIATTNMIVPLFIAETVLEKMKKKESGCIVNISSVAAKYGSNLKNVFYGMSKRGLEALTKSLARKGARYNVLVNTVRPGVTNTDFHKRTGKNLKIRKSLIPLKRMAQPKEIAHSIHFLCSNNTFITNEILTVAGGE